MIVSTHQPYFIPYAGFFYKARQSDMLVILDNVQFPRGTTWVSRNRLKNDQGTLWLTVPVWKKGLGLQSIREVRICHAFRWVAKHLASIRCAYARAPFLSDHMPFVEDTYHERFEKLIDLNLSFIRYLMRELNIDTEVKLQSELGIQTSGHQLLVDICRKMGASVYLAQPAARKYMDSELLHKEGLRIEFLKPTVWIYPQLWGSFIANLSVFDMLFNCGPRAQEILLPKSCTKINEKF
ncbi:MAG: WbqC family protein [Desulfobacterales bacterium]|nr:WbqC family protein [Desulfobacterales bacterium]